MVNITDFKKYVFDADEVRTKFPELNGAIRNMFWNYDKQELEIWEES